MTVIHTFVAYPSLIPGLIVICMGVGILVFGLTKLFCDNASNATACSVSCIMIGLTALIVGGVMAGAITETHHQILINDGTSFSEVQQRYEIIDQKGISYIVKEIGGE